MKKSVYLVLLTAVMFIGSIATGYGEVGQVAKWYFNPGAGLYDYEGDQDVTDGFVLSARLGYDFTEMWTLEGVFTLAPKLDVNTVGHTYIDANGNVIKEELNLGNFDSTYGAGLALDGLFHFTRWERSDPYLALGGGVFWFGDKVDGKTVHPAIRAGGGWMYHFNDEWAVRADARVMLAGQDTSANTIIDGGVVWTWGAHLAPDYTVVDGPLDSDADGLTDEDEARYGTDPLDPDTDKDGLKDGEEVHTYKTDPLNPDTDWDGLKDGAEVKKHETNPLLRDTDNGGVADGHEVIEDNTDPLNPADDLMLVELYIQFDYDKAVVRPEYFDDIDVIGKVLARHPDATAVIEGHADQTVKSSESHNKKLSEQRAKSVMTYLVEASGIDKSRLKAVGYGFSRPKVKPDLKNGNPENRRVEIYIRGADNTVEGGTGAQKTVLPENK